MTAQKSKSMLEARLRGVETQRTKVLQPPAAEGDRESIGIFPCPQLLDSAYKALQAAELL